MTVPPVEFPMPMFWGGLVVPYMYRCSPDRRYVRPRLIPSNIGHVSVVNTTLCACKTEKHPCPKFKNLPLDKIFRSKLQNRTHSKNCTSIEWALKSEYVH